jgi:hypothetical protein
MAGVSVMTGSGFGVVVVVEGNDVDDGGSLL